MTFASLGLHPDILRCIQALGFEEPTPIQREAIPPALEGRDLLACAMTGSGKTAAFLLPTIEHLMKRKVRGPRALVVTPTRELAAQIAADLADLAPRHKVTGAAVYGGVGMGPQEQAFRKGVDVLIATPGRLLDHLNSPYASLDTVEVLILDEADRMLDMGFLPDIRRILRRVPKDRQTLFFSATMPPEIAKLAAEMLHQPIKIATERKAAPATGVRQRVFSVLQTKKSEFLLNLLDDPNIKSALVFTRTKSRANRLCDFLEKRGVDAARIHGNRSQAQRLKALDAFKRGQVRVLVATDIAARGIDIDELSHVVNFDVPHVPEDYIHRVGRTARAARTGDAFTLVSPEEETDLRGIEKALGHKLERERAYDAAKAKTSDRREPAPEMVAEAHAETAAPRRSRPRNERLPVADFDRRAQTAPAKAPRSVPVERPRTRESQPARSRRLPTGAHHPGAPLLSAKGPAKGGRRGPRPPRRRSRS